MGKDKVMRIQSTTAKEDLGNPTPVPPVTMSSWAANSKFHDTLASAEEMKQLSIMFRLL